jgi:hypothetical protein
MPSIPFCYVSLMIKNTKSAIATLPNYLNQKVAQCFKDANITLESLKDL